MEGSVVTCIRTYVCDSILFQIWSLSDEALTNGQVFVFVASEFLHSSWPVRILLFFLHVEVSDFFSGRGWWGGVGFECFFCTFHVFDIFILVLSGRISRDCQVEGGL